MFIDESRIARASVPDDWPPTPEHMEVALLDIFAQHVVNRRDIVMRRAYDTVVGRRPYAQGRIHQRPFAALDELDLDEAAREKLVDVVAVFVDEMVERFLALQGSVLNTVGDYYTVDYEFVGQLQRHDLPASDRYGRDTLYSAWQHDLEQMVAHDELGDLKADPDVAEETYPRVSIGKQTPLWFDYRKWLNRLGAFRRSARPTRYVP